MRYLPNGVQMSAADRHTIEEIGIPSLVLMERAALKTVEAMHTHGIDTSRTLVVCGSGNNGGDGLALGRLLLARGYTVSFYEIGGVRHASESYQTQRKILENLGVHFL